MPLSYRALQSDGTWPRASLTPRAGPDALRQVETLGLRRSAWRKGRGRAVENGSPVGVIGNLFLLVRIGKRFPEGLENSTRLPPACSAGGPEPRAVILTRKPLPAARQMEGDHDLVIMACRWPPRWRRSPGPFRVFIPDGGSRLKRRVIDVVLAPNRRFPGAEKDLKSKVNRNGLSMHPAGGWRGRAHGVCWCFIRIPEGFQQRYTAPAVITQLIIGVSHVVRLRCFSRRPVSPSFLVRHLVRLRKGRRSGKTWFLQSPIIGR